MVNIDKIKNLAKERGIKLSFICSQLGLGRSYFQDVQKNGRDISDERLVTIAEILGTTPEYLRDESGTVVPNEEYQRVKSMLADMKAGKTKPAAAIIGFGGHGQEEVLDITEDEYAIVKAMLDAKRKSEGKK